MSSPRRRTALAAVLAAATAATVASAVPASAANTITCAYNPGHILAVGSGTTDKGFLYDYAYTGTSSDTTSSFAARVKIGSGWNGFGVIRAGSGGVVWAATTAGVMYNYDWNVGATSWSRTKLATPPPTGQASPWAAYTTAAGKKKITVDARNHIYVLDSSNRILRYAYDFTNSKWTTWAMPVAQLTGTFDMIWASDATVLNARRTDGTLQRIRIDATADRGLVTDSVGGQWQAFQNIFSLGADTQFAIATSNGALKKYRYDEDASKWTTTGTQIGTGWGGFLNVTGVVNTCSRTYTAPATSVPTEADAPIEALGTTDGKVYLAVSEGTGALKFAQVTSSAFTPVTWAQSNGLDAVTGRPAMALQSDGLVHAYTHTVGGAVKDQKEVKPTGPGTSTLDVGTTQRGVLGGHPDAAIMSNNTNALAATDGAGAIWVRQQGAFGDLQYTPWRRLGTGAAPNAPVTAQPYVANQTAFYVVAASGGVLTSTVSSAGTFAGPVDLGAPGAGAVGSVSAMTYPGGAQRIVVADSAGGIWTKAQNISTRVWDATWTAVQPGRTFTGSPAVQLSPQSGRVQIVARDAVTDFVAVASETGQNTRTFGDFTDLPSDNPVTLGTSPTVFDYYDAGVHRWGIIGYGQDPARSVWLWTSSSAAGSGNTGLERSAGSDDVMTLTKLGKLRR